MKNIRRKDHTVTQIAKNTYWINEFGAACCYLAVGEEKALLIDTGLGLGDLKAVVKDITDKPLIVAATHGHLDHIGGAGQFREIYMHKNDITFYEMLSRKMFARKGFIKSAMNLDEAEFSLSDLKRDEVKTKYIPIDEGHVFSLGGRDIRVIHTPGHTKGSVVFIDDAENVAFTGDNMNVCLFMFLPDSITLEGWKKGARRIMELSKTHTLYCGHPPGVQTTEELSETYAMAEKVLADNPKNSLFKKSVRYPDRKEFPIIIYNTKKLR